MARSHSGRRPADPPEDCGPPVTLAQVWELLQSLNQRQETTMVNLQNLVDAVGVLRQTIQTATEKIAELKDQIGQDEAVQGQIDQLEAEANDLTNQLLDATNSAHVTNQAGGVNPAETGAPPASRPTPAGRPTPATPAAVSAPPASRPTPATPRPGGHRIGGT